MSTTGLKHPENLFVSGMGWAGLMAMVFFFGCQAQNTGPQAPTPVTEEAAMVESTAPVAQTREQTDQTTESVESIEANEADAIVVRQDMPLESERTRARAADNETISVVQNLLGETDTGSPGEIFIREQVYDFGELTPKDIPTGQFIIQNVGKGILNITNVKVCCGAQHKLDKERLLPNETATLDLKYHASYVGPFEKYITVYSDDPKQPGVRLTIKGDVVRKLEWTPQRFKLFLNQDNGGCQPLTIKSLDDQPFALTSFKSTNDALTFAVDPNQEATEFTVVPTVDLETLKGLEIAKGMVYVHHTHPGSDRIALAYDLVRRFSFTPHTFLVFNASPDRSRTQRLNVIDNYAGTLGQASEQANIKFKIESVTVEKETAKVIKQSDIKDGYQLEFEISPPEPAGQSHFTDRVTIQLSTGDEIRIPINGIYSTKVLSESGRQAPVR